jgi:hypothetical protein
MHIELSQDIGDEFDELWETVNGEYFWIQNRGRDFVRWRYAQDPTRDYQIWKATEEKKLIGYLITTINRSPARTRGLLVDWLVSRKREDVFRQMVKTAGRWLIDQKVDLIRAWVTNHEQKWIKVLRSLIFVKRDLKVSFIVIERPESNNPDLKNANNFFFTIGDSDYLGAYENKVESLELF